ncbi:MAG: protein phosphatase 2C domain-containing protein [Acidobacteriota bacterium]
MAGRASIVGAAETSVGKVRDHNEDSHYIDPELGIFLVCDGMGGHAAGEVASALAVQTIRERWASDATQGIADQWLSAGTPDARRLLLTTVRDGVLAAHDAILEEARHDRTKGGMGTTLVGAMVVGGDIVFAHCGDSRAYLVRDGIAMQLTEDHTLLARLLAAGVDVDVQGDGARFKSMLTNALGIGDEVKVSSFVVPLADGDRFLLCSDGITEYIDEPEIGEVLCKMPSPARAAQRLVELALQRGGGDNATAMVVRVLEAGETSRPAEVIQREDKAIHACPLWAKVNPQQRLRALRIAIPRDHAAGEKLAASTLGDRVAWILVEGEVDHEGEVRGPGTLLYPEALLLDRPLPDKDALAIARGEVRALALRCDDFRELCDDDADLAEALLDALGVEIARRSPPRRTGRFSAVAAAIDAAEPEADVLPDLPQPGPPVRRGDTLPPPALTRAPSVPPGNRLIVPKGETDSAVDEALSKITFDDTWASLADDERPPEPPPPQDEPPGDDEPDVIIVEAAEPPSPPPVRELARPSRPRLGDHSDAEISIEAIDDEPPPELVNVKEEDPARVVEIVEETSSQQIVMTVEEPAEPEIVIVPPSGPHAVEEPKRAKSEPPS